MITPAALAAGRRFNPTLAFWPGLSYNVVNRQAGVMETDRLPKGDFVRRRRFSSFPRGFGA
jgi:hypothetical protein